MDQTEHLSMPYILPQQAQKHVTHNEALRVLDVVVQAAVDSQTLQAPPDPVAVGATFIPASGAYGDFAGHENQIGTLQEGGWTWCAPKEGWRIWDRESGRPFVFVSGGWRGESQQMALMGINASADATNRLTSRAEATLLDAQDGDHRLKINKLDETDTASVIFQQAYTGHAEIGLAGDNALHVRTSTDGIGFQDALVVDPTSGQVALPRTGPVRNVLVNGDLAENRRAFAGGALSAGIYGPDRWKAGASGASLTVAAGQVTLASGSIVQIVETALWGLGAGQSVTVSAQVASGTLTVSIGGVACTLPAMAGRAQASVQLPPGTGATLAVELSGAGCVFSRVKLEAGRFASPWQVPLPHERDALLSRYCQRVRPPALGIFLPLVHFASGDLRGVIQFRHEMRAAPTVSFLNSDQFRIYPNPGTFVLAFQSVDQAYVNLVATASGTTTDGAAYLLRSALSGTAAILLEAEL